MDEAFNLDEATLEARKRLQAVNHSKVRMGEWLAYVREKLTGTKWNKKGGGLRQNPWYRWLETIPLSERTAKRYLECYRNAKSALPEKVFATAMERGIDLSGNPRQPFGKYTSAVQRIGKPSQRSGSEWVDRVVGVHSEQIRTIKRNARFLGYDDYVERGVEKLLEIADRVPITQRPKFVTEVIEKVIIRLKATLKPATAAS